MWSCLCDMRTAGAAGRARAARKHGGKRVLESCGHLLEVTAWELEAESAALMNS